MEFSNHRNSSIVNQDSREERNSPSDNSHANSDYFPKKQSNKSVTTPENSDVNPIDTSEIITNSQESNGFESVAIDSPKRKDTARQYAPQPEDPDQDKNAKDDDIYVDVEHFCLATLPMNHQ